MKEFRKTHESLFICEECGLTTTRKTSLSHHIKHKHNYKKYFDKWIKEECDGICKICNEQTKFLNFQYGYKKCCCKEHELKYIDICAKKTLQKRYNVDSPFSLSMYREKSRETKKKRYGNENYRNDEKIKKTCVEKYGVENVLQSKEIRKKNKENMCRKIWC